MYQFKKNKFGILLASLSVSALIACSPVIHNRGYILVQEKLNQVEMGKTNKENVRIIMGSPSTIATIDASIFYYISSQVEAYLYRAPVEKTRKIVAIYFDEKNTVTNIAHYGLEDGNIVDYVKRKTVTRGKELTVLGQLFGNLGRFNSAGPSNVPGGGN